MATQKLAMRIVRPLCTAGLLLASLHAQAEAGWTDHGAVLELTPTIHERFLVKLAVSENPSGCKEQQTFYQDFALSGVDKMYHTLLEALLSRKKVRVFVTGRCDLDGNAEISSLSIVP